MRRRDRRDRDVWSETVVVNSRDNVRGGGGG